MGASKDKESSGRLFWGRPFAHAVMDRQIINIYGAEGFIGYNVRGMEAAGYWPTLEGVTPEECWHCKTTREEFLDRIRDAIRTERLLDALE